MADFTFDRTYRPRSVASLGLWRIRNWTFKAYGIHFDPNQPRMFTAQRLETARIHAANQLAMAETFGISEEVGYLILNQERSDLWHLQHWWTEGETIAGVMSRLNDSNQFIRASDPYIASLSELAVMVHERDAWMRSMLTSSPDPKTYLTQWLPNGMY